MRAIDNTNPKVWENRMRREARRHGLELTKARGLGQWFLTGDGRDPRHFTSLDAVEAYLTEHAAVWRYRSTVVAPKDSRRGEALAMAAVA